MPTTRVIVLHWILSCVAISGCEFQGAFAAMIQSMPATNHGLTYPKRAQMNAQIERFKRTVQEDFSIIMQRHDLPIWHNSTTAYGLTWSGITCTDRNAGIVQRTPVQMLISNNPKKSSRWWHRTAF